MKNALQIVINVQQILLVMFAQMDTIKTPLKNALSAQASFLIASSATIRSVNNARILPFMWQIPENASLVIQLITIAQLAAMLLTASLASLTHTFPVEFALNVITLIQAVSLASLSPPISFAHPAAIIII